MKEVYYKYKSNYPDYIIFIKAGSFYEIFSKDALIINKLFNYKIKLKNNTLQVGFPINSINNVTNIIKDNNLYYIVVDKDIIIDKYNNGINNYNKYIFDIDSIIYNFYKLDKIIKYLDNNIMNNNINEKLDIIIRVLENDKID